MLASSAPAQAADAAGPARVQSDSQLPRRVTRTKSAPLGAAAPPSSRSPKVRQRAGLDFGGRGRLQLSERTSPFCQAQSLCTVVMRERSLQREAVSGDGSVRVVSSGRLPSHVAQPSRDPPARLAAEPPGRMRDIIAAAFKEFDLKLPACPKERRGAEAAAALAPQSPSRIEWKPESPLYGKRPPASDSSGSSIEWKPESPESEKPATAGDSPGTSTSSSSTSGTPQRTSPIAAAPGHISVVSVPPLPRSSSTPGSAASKAGGSADGGTPLSGSSLANLHAHGHAASRPSSSLSSRPSSQRGSERGGSKDSHAFVHSHRNSVCGEPSPASSPAAGKSPPLIPWEQEMLREAFKTFDRFGEKEVHVSDLPHVLGCLGVQADEEKVKEIVQILTRYASLNWVEFIDFLNIYREWELDELRKAFNRVDYNGDGTLDLDETIDLLHNFGYPSTRQTALEIIHANDTNHDGCVDFQEFESLLHHVRSTAGFNRSDLQHLRQLFDRVAGSSVDRKMPAEEIWRVLIFSGYPTTQEDVRRLYQDFGHQADSRIGFWDMLKVFRAHLQRERQAIQRFLESRAGKAGGRTAVDKEDLGLVLGHHGYNSSEEAILETLMEVGVPDAQKELALDELFAFLHAFRRNEGFTDAERADLQAAFEREDQDGCGSINALQLGQVLRWLGFPLRLQAQQRALWEVDLDGSGRIEFYEFLKLVRGLYSHEAAWRRQMFDSMAELSPYGFTRMPVADMSKALAGLHGDVPPADRLAAAVDVCVQRGFIAGPGALLDHRGFERVCAAYRALRIAYGRKNAGYGPTEIARFQDRFRKYDTNHSGFIDNGEMRFMLEEAFPWASNSRAHQERMQTLLKRADADGNGQISFEEFLWLMRAADDIREADEVDEEARIVAGLGLSAEEVEGFREVYLQKSGPDGALSQSILVEMFEFAHFGEEQSQRLHQLIQDVDTESHGAAVGFPVFLKLAKQIMEDPLLSKRILVRQERMAKQEQILVGVMQEASPSRTWRDARRYTVFAEAAAPPASALQEYL